MIFDKEIFSIIIKKSLLFFCLMIKNPIKFKFPHTNKKKTFTKINIYPLISQIFLFDQKLISVQVR